MQNTSPFFKLAIATLSSLLVTGAVSSALAQDAAPTAQATPSPKPEAKTEAAPAKPTSLTLLTRAVGEVSDRIVTSREVRINDAIEQALTEKAASPEGFRLLTGQEKAFPGEVSRVLDEWIVFLEAKTLSSQGASKADVNAGVKAVQDLWGGKSTWLELEVSADEIKDIIERKLVSKNFEKLKSDPQLAPVSDDDALAYYRKNRLRFGSLPFSSFKDNIKTFLVKQQTERRLAEWREVLRRKYKVRNFIAG